MVLAFPDTVRQCPQYGHVVTQRPDWRTLARALILSETRAEFLAILADYKVGA
jgi:hypothetical protein